MPFTPANTLLGGALLHLSTSSLLADTGRVLGISGVLDGALLGDGYSWRWATVLGLIGGPLLGSALGLEGIFAGDALAGWSAIGLGRSILAGTFVGLGSRLGSGCTSGHFLCGVSRGSKRSLVATASFFSAALLTANTVPLPAIASKSPLYLPVYPTRREMITLLLIFVSFRLAQSSLTRYLKSFSPSPSSSRSSPSLALRNTPYLLAGLTFSFGLLISGMADPFKVLSFLRPLPPFKAFDPSLAMVVLSGVIPNAVHWVRVPKGKTGYKWEKWAVPSRQDIDWRLLVGSAIFGVGWGLAGVCPGPAVVGVGKALAGLLSGESETGAVKSIGAFAGAMIVGMGLARGI